MPDALFTLWFTPFRLFLTLIAGVTERYTSLRIYLDEMRARHTT